MKKIKFIAIAALVLLTFVSCATGTNIKEKNEDGSPIWTTVIPESNRLLYGVGSAKFSNDKNSSDASYSAAVTDLARKISVRIKDASSAYSSDADSNVLSAYENIRTLTVNVTLKGVKTVERWKAEDGTVWTLVSFEIKKLPEIYSDAANTWKAQQEEKKLSILNKLVLLQGNLDGRSDEKAIEMNALAEQRANEMVFEIDQTLAGVREEEIAETIRANLLADGYSYEEAETSGEIK